MSNKIKVYNDNKYNFGVVFPDGVRQANVRAGSFILMDEDEIYFLHSISRAFSGKHLNVKEQHILENMGLAEPEDKAFTEEELINILKGNNLKMQKELEKITEENQKYRVYDIAKTLDLPASKIKFIEEFTGRNVLESDPQV